MTRPRVTVHYAQTLDGRLATRTGHSQWISCPETLQLAHQIRAGHQAVLVGVGTVLADDPQLTVRLVSGPSPLRVIVDSTLRTPLDANVITDKMVPTLMATTDRAPSGVQQTLRDAGVEVLVVGKGQATEQSGRVSLAALLGELGRRGIETVLIEGGTGIITSALRERLVDRLIVCVAPKIVGAGIEAIGDLGIERMGDALRLGEMRSERIGDDLVIEGRPLYG